MRLKKILILLGILILFCSALFFKLKATGHVIEAKYSFTKAICNATNYCQDYEFICEGDKLISAKPITGAIVQFSEDWEDPRTLEEIRRSCD